jgi:Fe-S-cluster containining protein
LSAQVEATVLECIPLAFLLFRTSQAEQVLDLLEQNGDAHRCILYRPDLTRAGLWGCAQYRCRPVVCRLFGFAGNRGRDGIARLAMCRIMKDMAGPERTGIVADDAAGSTMPLFVDAGLCITALHPSLGTVRMPINIALWEALMKVGMALNLTTKASGEES